MTPRTLKVSTYLAEGKKKSKAASNGLQVQVRKGKRGKDAEIALQARIEAIVAEAKKHENAESGVDVMHDFRRGFDRKYSVHALKLS